MLTKWTRVEECALDVQDPRYKCALTYDSTTATLRGTIRSTCTPDPQLQSIKVKLTELEPPNRDWARIRPGVVDLGGVYDIGALRPGRYLFQVTDAQYIVAPDTVLVSAGRVNTFDKTIYYVGTCPTH